MISLQKERRNEVRMRRKLELKEAYENASLLKEMLDQLAQAKESGADDVNEDVLATIKDLYESCKKLESTMFILTGDLKDSELLGSI